MQTFDITAFGAEPDTLCTQAIQAAFDAADAAGGTVVVPRGTYLTGTVNMRSASLVLEKGAVLKGSPDRRDYRPIGYIHNELGDVTSLLYAKHVRDITIGGEGKIDLNGGAFYDFDKPIASKDDVMPMTPEQWAECTVEHGFRPNQPICFLECHHVTVRGITITDAPCWTLCFLQCTDVRVLDLDIDNRLNVPNCDGMHFCGCRDMFVRGCRITAGDDCIAFSSITDWNQPCERAVVSDCVFCSASKAISIGYMHSIVRDITISNCIVNRSNRAVAIMSSAKTGLVEDVLLSNLRLDARVYAGNWWGHGEPICLMTTRHNNDTYRDGQPEDRFDVSIRRIQMQNIIASGENAMAMVSDEETIEEVWMDGVVYRRLDSPNLPLRGHMIDLAPGRQTARLDEDECCWLYLRDVQDVHITRARALPWHDREMTVYEENCRGVTIRTE